MINISFWPLEFERKSLKCVFVYLCRYSQTLARLLRETELCNRFPHHSQGSEWSVLAELLPPQDALSSLADFTLYTALC